MCIFVVPEPTKTSSNSASTTFGSSSLVGDTGGASACFALPLKAATAAMTLFGFFVGLGGGSIAPIFISLPLSVLARPNVGLEGLHFDGELSLVLSPFPCASVSGARSVLFLREKVSSNDVVDDVLGTCIDFGRSLGAGRFCKEGWLTSKLLRCFDGE